MPSNLLGEVFVEALFEDFREHGVEAIVEMRSADPSGYIRAIAGLLPREAGVEAKDEFSEGEIAPRLACLVHEAPIRDNAAARSYSKSVALQS